MTCGNPNIQLTARCHKLCDKFPSQEEDNIHIEKYFKTIFIKFSILILIFLSFVPFISFPDVKMGHKHALFLARTVLVKNNNVEQACGTMNRIMGREDLLDQWRRSRYFERPSQTRRRINYEKCKAIYNEDMERRIQLIMRKHRVDPFPGCN